MTWAPDPDAFVRDLEAKPAALRALAPLLESDPWCGLDTPVRIVCIGMGSSRFAALPIGGMLRALGRDVVIERASATDATPAAPGTLAVGISASGSTPETVAALTRHRDGGSTTIAITEAEGSALGAVADRHIALHAGEETGGVACRTFQHTIAVLLALVDAPRASAAVRRAADATEDLLDRRSTWLPAAVDELGTASVFVIAPEERISSAEQSSLMFREGPRLQADACETGDWLHVDVYLTKPLDYRALLFTGSGFDADVRRWIDERSGRLVSIGAGGIRYRGDEDPDVALLTETLVSELVAADVWRRQA
ncbi:MAG TPA: SIS domain-containing protein [Actinomycetota bacterium]|nr:SIS domain-containing protein [Actinomycetota bacterium]